MKRAIALAAVVVLFALLFAYKRESAPAPAVQPSAAQIPADDPGRVLTDAADGPRCKALFDKSKALLAADVKRLGISSEQAPPAFEPCFWTGLIHEADAACIEAATHHDQLTVCINVWAKRINAMK